MSVKHLFAVVVFVALASPVAAQERKPKPPEGAAVYDVYVEPWKTRFTQDWRREVEKLQTNIRTATPRANAVVARRIDGVRSGWLPANIKIAEAILKDARDDQVRLSGLLKNDPPFFAAGKTDQDLSMWKEQDYGTCSYKPIILQVTDENYVLLGNQDNPAIVKLQVPTAGLVDGALYDFGTQFIHVKGKITYFTPYGAKKTVLLAEVLDRNSLKR